MTTVLFTLRKTVEALVMPFPLVCWVLVGGALLQVAKRPSLQKLGRRAMIAALVGLVALAYGIPFDLIGRYLEGRYPPITDTASLTNVKYISVLGGDVLDHPDVPVSSLLGPASTYRAAEGIRLHQAIPGSKIIFTGYAEHGTMSSATAGLLFAESMGVPRTAIVVDSTPLTTADEVRTAKRVAGDSALIVVTSAFHMPRAMMLFRKGGLHPIAAPTGYRANLRRESFREWIVPSAERVFFSGVVMHEILGILVEKLKK